MAARSLPAPGEIALLEPYRDRLPAEAFTRVFEPPATDGSGTSGATFARRNGCSAKPDTR